MGRDVMEGEYGLSWRVCGWNAGFDQKICSGFEMWEKIEVVVFVGG
jgi:hypothetical protein